MNTPDLKEKLNKLDTDKLIDVVKNYKKYGYSDEIRAHALALLENQGLGTEDLRITGNLENSSYNFATDIYQLFTKNSTIAFIAYCLILIIKGLIIFHYIEQSALTSVILIISTLVFLISLIKSFLNQNDFFKVTGSSYGSEGALYYFLLGMPLYFIMYFYFRKQMKERLNYIE